MRVAWLIALLGFYSVIWSAPVRASATPLTLSSDVQQIGNYISLYHSASGVSDVLALPPEQFTPVASEFVTFRQARGGYWLRFSLRNAGDKDAQRIISFDYPHVRNLVLYKDRGGQLEELTTVSAQMALQERRLLSRYPALLFDVPRQSTHTYYMHLQLQGKTNQALEYQLRLYPPGDFITQQLGSYTVLVGFIGFMLSLLIYNLILYTRVGIRGYLYYSLYLVAQIVGLMAFEGFFYLMPQPFSVSTVVLLMTVSPMLCGLFLIQFGRDILDLHQNMPRVNQALIVISGVLFVMLLMAAAGASWINLLMEGMGLLTIVAIAVIAVVIFRRGSKAALYFSISFAFLFLGYGTEMVLYSIPTMSADEPLLSAPVLQWMERYFYYSSAALEMVFLSLALAAYIVQIRDDMEIAQTESILNLQEREKIQQEYSTQLEHDIVERTSEITTQSQLLAEQAGRLKELDNLKSRFFTNLSHEFRTPLTLIRGPVQGFLAGEYGPLEGSASEAMEIAARNTDRLSMLIDELLMLAELESGSIGLQSTEQDIYAFCRRSASLFTHTAHERNIAFEVIAGEGELPVFFDVRKIEKVVSNLLSNAFKYSADGGRVSLAVRVRDEEQGKSTGNFVEIVVSDSGVGIAEEQLSHVFERFYRTEASADSFVEGSGIGLALVKELVELHGGEIQLVSTLSEQVNDASGGSCFTVVLPLGHEHLTPGEIRVDAIHSVSAVDSQQLDGDQTSDARQATLLVVEDNTDMRTFVVSRLEPDYRVLQAVHGKQALEVLERESVDLILSDVMMPELDGIGLLEQVRANPATRHLPVILLTARSSDEDRLLALRAQADEILAKPFQDEELRLKISNLLWRNRQPTAAPVPDSPVHLPAEPLDSAEVVFLEKATAAVQDHMNDMGFDVSGLAEALHISRSTLRRRMKQAANITPAEFIRQLRLQRAHQYLTTGHFRTLAETAYAVGFSQPGYFSRLYQKYTAGLSDPV